MNSSAAAHDPTEYLLERLENVRRTDSGIMASCPVAGHKHDDRNRSLSVTPGTSSSGVGLVLAHCHTGHTLEDITEALDVPMTAMFADYRNGTGPTPAPRQPKKQRRRYRARAGDMRYELRGEDGELVAWHVRSRNKDIVWVGADALLGLDGRPKSSLPLYGADRLPTMDRDKPVYIVEGEHAADVAQRAGLQVLATVTGAGECPDVDVLDQLATWTAPVVLCPDNDDVGRTHMEGIRTALPSLDYRVLDMDGTGDGHDLADLLHGGTAAQDHADVAVAPTAAMVEAVAQLPDRWQAQGPADDVFRSADTLYDIEAASWFVPGLASPYCITDLTARPKAGKTQLMLGIGRAWLTDEPFLGQLIDLDVLLYMTEQAGPTMADQLRRGGLNRELLADNAGRFRVVGMFDSSMNVESWQDRCAKVQRLIETRYPGRRVLVVVDTFAKWAGLREGQENDSGATGQAMLPLQRMAQETGAAVVMLRHRGKPDDRGDEEHEEVTNAGRGSNAAAGDADIVVTLTRPSHRVATQHAAEDGAEGMVRRLRGVGRLGGIVDDALVRWDRASGRFDLIEEADVYAGNIVMRALRDAGEPLDVAGIVSATGLAFFTVQAECRRLHEAGELIREGAGRRGHPYRYAAAAFLVDEDASTRNARPSGAPALGGTAAVATGACARMETWRDTSTRNVEKLVEVVPHGPARELPEHGPGDLRQAALDIFGDMLA